MGHIRIDFARLSRFFSGVRSQESGVRIDLVRSAALRAFDSLRSLRADYGLRQSGRTLSVSVPSTYVLGYKSVAPEGLDLRLATDSWLLTTVFNTLLSAPSPERCMTSMKRSAIGITLI